MESVTPGGSDLRVAAEIEATEDAVPLEGNESLSPSRAVAASTGPESTGSEEPLITAGPESKEELPSGTEESVPKTTLELNEHLLDEAHPSHVSDSSMLSSLAGVPGAYHGQPSALPNKHDSRQGCDRLKSKGQFVAETMLHLSSKPLNSGHAGFCAMCMRRSVTAWMDWSLAQRVRRASQSSQGSFS